MSEVEKCQRIPIPRPRVLMAIAVVLIPLAGLLTLWLAYHSEQGAIREIERLGGTVNTEEGGPEWLRRLLGDKAMEWFSRVSSLNLDGTGNRFDDEGLKYVSRFTRVVQLDLQGTQITDSGLQHLAQHANLRFLGLGRTRVF